MRYAMLSVVRGLGVTALAVVVAGCSFSIGRDSAADIQTAAEELIEELNDEGDLGITATECEVPDDNKAGTEFTCSSKTASGATIEWLAEISEDEVNVNSTNLVSTEAAERLEEVVAELAVENTGVPYTAKDVDCGAPPIVLDDDMTTVCVLSLSGGGSQRLGIEFTDLDTGDFELVALD